MIVLLYYHYIPITNPEKLQEKHWEFIQTLDSSHEPIPEKNTHTSIESLRGITSPLKGRIIVASEGINGTISGNQQDCNAYKKFLEHELKLEPGTINFKDDTCQQHVFPKLTVKVKKEIIRMGVKANPLEITGKHLKPDEWHKEIQNPNNVILDMRSNYEHKLGHFKDAVCFDINNMYEFPEVFKTHPLFKGEEAKKKNYLMYCTGGIKCEKASNFMMKRGFKNVSQLHGGIIMYGKEQGGENFNGQCYVFDGRTATNVNTVNPEIVSKCFGCNEKTDTMVNCMNTKCNRHTTMCHKCYMLYNSCCSLECSKSPNKREVYVDYFAN